jgi:hypothetical protein
MSTKTLNKLNEFRILTQTLRDIRQFGIYSLDEIQQLKSEIIAKAEILLGFDVEAINKLLSSLISKALSNQRNPLSIGILTTPLLLEA